MVVTSKGVWCAGMERLGPEMLLNSLQGMAQPHATKNYVAQNVSSAKAEKLWSLAFFVNTIYTFLSR